MDVGLNHSTEEQAMKSTAFSLAAGILVFCGMGQVQAGIIVTVDPAGVQSSQLPQVRTETFDQFANGTSYTSLSTAVGNLVAADGDKFAVVNADQYGGAGGTGKFLAIGAQTGYFATSEVVTLNLPGAQTSLGLWWSAADRGNEVQLYSNNQLLGTYTTSSLFGSAGSSYYGNPNSGQDSGEPFAYINFRATDGTTFDKVVFSENLPGAGFEIDNISIPNFQSVSPAPAGVPEPSGLVMLLGLGGMGIIGWWRTRRVG
ncbi:MAG: PEP-CTERM sorting domain-containing protein [Planctomycetes bacterium]|nr:PEP-CTERM sorting domain-containing protein [Planctomycetota bacterium]